MPDRWSPTGKHCLVTGGSQGLGLELARLLVTQGAHVSIVARDQSRLDAAIRTLESSRTSDGQIIRAYSFDLTDPDQAAAAIDAASAAHEGVPPHAFLLCAGAAKPGFFLDQTSEDLRAGLDTAYWVQAYTAHAAARSLVRSRTASGAKIVFVGSLLSYFSLIGYSPYTPAKHALRGLADTLRSELQVYGTEVQLYVPPTLYTQHLENENKTKPKITLKIEERDGGLQPEVAAKHMLEGIVRGDAHVTGDFITNVARASTTGATPYSNVFMDCMYGCIGAFALADWRRGVDKLVRGHRDEHEGYLKSSGFYD